MKNHTLGTPELTALAQAYEHYGRGETLTADDLRVLMRLARAVLAYEDPRPLFYIPLEGAPPSEHRFFVALHVLLLGDPSDKVIRGTVADAWGLKDSSVRDILRDMRDDAARILASTKDPMGLLAVVDWHRAKYLRDNSPSSAAT
jgi:hypothetical protein